MIIHIPEKYRFDYLVETEDCHTDVSNDIWKIAIEIFQIISDKVKETIADKDAQQAETCLYLGEEVSIPYVCDLGDVNYPLYELFGLRGDASIHYKVYALDPCNRDYHKQCQIISGKSFCDCDFEKGFIDVETYINDGQLNDSFVNDIAEEIVHYFNNDGNFSHKLKELCQSDNEQKQNIGYALLSSFPSAQDAMINELFSATEIDKIKELFYTDKYSISPDIKRFWDIIEEIKHEQPTIILESVGYTFNQFAKRINKLDRQMERKMEKMLSNVNNEKINA